MDLNDRTVIITGAGSGIGRIACEVFAAAGATVIAADIHPEPAQDAADAVDGIAVAGDVSDPEVWDELVDAAGDRLAAVYLNAGLYGHNGPIDELPLDLYQRTVDANIGGVVLGTRACVPALRANGGGAIVVTASVAGIVAFDGNPLYTLTKQAVAGFVRAVAPSLAPDKISIDAVCPGIVDTPMTVEALGGASPSELGIGLIDPADIARTALDLATSEGTGRCRAVRGTGGPPVDWEFPTWVDLAKA
ncbi:SDR family oxidoreductase [Actinospongicola halichondriae]|uniref:SDR family oxidoreductase n=1 Tax=Actinospongicola halichondriae TaxID=3236844 RepID=UPI003D53BB3A